MNTILEMMALVGLAVLYALAWHNQPVREPAAARRSVASPKTRRLNSAPSQGDL